MRRSDLPAALFDPTPWPSVDTSAMSGKRRGIYLWREQAVSAYLRGESRSDIERRFGINRASLTRLVGRILFCLHANAIRLEFERASRDPSQAALDARRCASMPAKHPLLSFTGDSMRLALMLAFGGLVALSTPVGAFPIQYLYIPPIVGSASEPGFPGLIPILSFSLSGNSAFLDKLVDATSPEFFTAAVSGTHFPVADVLMYEPGAAAPSLSYDLTGAVVSSDTTVSSGGQLHEQLQISFASANVIYVGPTPVPEPTTPALLLAGLLAASCLAMKRRWTPGRTASTTGGAMQAARP